MKLLRLELELKDTFRSLPKDFKISFYPDLDSKDINPICLVGSNGSGKSNVLEVAAEIFYFLDLLHLDYGDKSLSEVVKFGFEIEYEMPITFDNAIGTIGEQSYPFNNAFRKVLIKKPYEKPPRFYYADSNSEEKEITNKEDTKKLLPTKIVGYSSGLNELLSNPFIKMRFHYFNEYEKKVKNKVFDKIEDSRMVFMNYEANSAILISNYLMQEEVLKPLIEQTKIESIDSFRISLQLKNYKRNEVVLSPKLRDDIDKLKKCATLYHDDREGKSKTLIIDFFVDEQTKKSFKHNFSSAFELFKTFQLLELLNIHCLKVAKRNEIRKVARSVNISDQIPKPDPNELVFKIEKLTLNISKLENPIKYKNISDGEHQFLHIIGTIMMMEEPGTFFLLDEPETHFNPIWRSKMISIMNKVLRIKRVKEDKLLNNRDQEIIMTTHSPFVLSDCKQNNVFVFEKNHGKVKHQRIKVQTYGASTRVLLEEAFSQDYSISEMSRTKINNLKKRRIDSEDDIMKIKKEAGELLGDSVEKILLFNYLNTKLQEIKKRK